MIIITRNNIFMRNIRFVLKHNVVSSSQKVAYTVVVFSFEFWREDPKKVTKYGANKGEYNHVVLTL